MRSLSWGSVDRGVITPREIAINFLETNRLELGYCAIAKGMIAYFPRFIAYLNRESVTVFVSAETVVFAISRVESSVIHRKIFFEPGCGFCFSVDKGYYPSLHELLLDHISQNRLLPKALGGQGGPQQQSQNYGPAVSPQPKFNSAPVSVVRTRVDTPKEKWEIPASELTREVLVGKGGFGEVYRGKWRGSTVAIKVMIGTPKPEEVLQFKNEAALLA